MFDLLKAPRRQRLRETPLADDDWRRLEDAVPLVRRLNDQERGRLAGLVQIFLDEKVFEGGRGFEVTHEMKLVIAAEACLLLIHRQEEVPYPELVNVIVYESAWRSKTQEHVGGGVLLEQRVANLGESWNTDTVILSWDRVAYDAQNARDGHNVALHEFAHQLDAQDGVVDGAPQLPSRARYATWARIFSQEFEALREGDASVIDDYGAHSPPEFFAVVTEMFFERPDTLLAHHPELFVQLEKFYGFDPHQLHPPQVLEPPPSSG